MKSDLKGKQRFFFFYRKESPFSQFHSSKFSVDDKEFSCAEQYMMYSKAVLFNDEVMKKAILKTSNPAEMKKCGRRVKDFDADVWNKHCVDIVRTGNEAKFSQNETLKEQLFQTYPKTLAEASPMDRIWGIGLSEKNELAWDSKTWRGKNLLGYTLTEVRDKLMKDEDLID
ncbi:hypothetical protein LOTGIDRAFT_220498 [Lottia gigantea]|uniref:NADAR domain-containing protein n=1 Tax=Lottia gigantea TaxID=225164 RepID=V4BDJ4_LOTGI|nr:hypothetical protein LOTGIDRAFT_220498 [Lottia gigantea]ESO86704.1 hypothetical protein LOTGIDRAFT_220498 [Lottia gigantea]